MLEIALIVIASAAAFGMGFVGGQAWQGRMERLMNPHAGTWEGDE